MDRLWSREEIINLIKLYSSSITKEEIQKMIDETVKNIEEKIDLLWSNENYLDEFSKQTINLLNINKYKKLLIFYINSNTQGIQLNNKIIYVNNGEKKLSKVELQLSLINDYNFYRNIKINTLMGSFDFENCIYNDYNNKTSETNNNYLIPYCICGVI